MTVLKTETETETVVFSRNTDRNRVLAIQNRYNTIKNIFYILLILAFIFYNAYLWHTTKVKGKYFLALIKHDNDQKVWLLKMNAKCAELLSLQKHELQIALCPLLRHITHRIHNSNISIIATTKGLFTYVLLFYFNLYTMFSTLFCVNAVCHWFIKLLSDLISLALMTAKTICQILVH